MKNRNLRVAPAGGFPVNGRDAATAAMLSVIPGLGQFYNGQSVKGFLFMDVAVVNAILLTVVLFAEPMAKNLRTLLVDNHVRPNEGVLQALSSAHLGTPFSLVLTSSILLFVGFAIRDAYDCARQQKLKPIYADSALNLSEAASGSYLVHFVAMFGCAIFTLCFLIPLPARQQIMEIQFTDPVQKDVEPIKAKKFSTNSSSARHKEIQVKNPTPANSSASQARSSQQSHQRATKSEPAPTSKPTPAVKPTPVTKPTPAQHQATSDPAPAPPIVKPLPSAMRPVPAPLKSAPAPTPLNVSKLTTPAATANSAPLPQLLKPVGSSNAPLPMLAMAPAATQGPGPAPLAINHASGGTVGAPQPAEARRSGSSSSLVNGAPAPISSSSTAGFSNNVSPAPISGAHSHGTAPGSPGQSLTPTKIASVLPPGGGIASRPVGGAAAPRVDSRGDDTDSGVGKAPVSAYGLPDFGPYMAELQRRIKRNWQPPKDKNTRQVVVDFTIFKSGELGAMHVSKTSGVLVNDQAAMAAIHAAAPFMPLPKNSENSVDIQFTFDYRVFGGHADY